MKFATVRNLKNQTSEMLRLAAKGTDVLITSHGKPVAMLHCLGEEDVEDFVLGRHHGLRKSIEDAEREYRKRGGVPLAEVVRRRKGEETQQPWQSTPLNSRPSPRGQLRHLHSSC